MTTATDAMHSLQRVAWLARKEFWQLRSDKIFTAMLICLPLMQLVLVVNIVAGDGGAGSPIAVVDHDRSRISRELIRALENTKETHVRLDLGRVRDGDEALRQGEVDGLVVIPPGFEQDFVAANHSPELLAVVDGTNSVSAAGILGSVSGALSRFSESTGAGKAMAALSLRPTKYFEVTKVQDPVSSQFGFLLYEVVIMASVMGLARERETGTLEQLLVTPLSRFELIVGKAAPALVIGILDFGLLFVVARAIWDVPMRGSLGLLAFSAVLFILAESAWGLFLSSRVANQQQAVQIMFVQILFDMAFCGYIVPVHNLPGFLRWVPEMLPVQHYLQCVRVIMLRGGGWGPAAAHIGALVGLNLVYWALSVSVLSRRLD